MKAATILIADTHLLLCSVWELYLNQDSRFSVIGHACSGAEALAKSLALNPDIVLLDIKLTVMDGLSACAEIRKQMQKVKIIGISSSTEPYQVQQFLNVGATSYVSKYARASDLTEAILSTLEGNRWICNYVKDKYLTQLPVRNKSSFGSSSLSLREQEVAGFVLKGHSSAEIAAIMGISVRTVEVYRARLFKKLGINKRTQLVNLLHHEVKSAPVGRAA